MSKSVEGLQVVRVDEYSDELAAGYGQLMPELSPKHTDEPVSKQRLRRIINSPDRELFIATVGERIIGSVTMNTIVKPTNEFGWFDNFVVVEEFQGTTVAFALWRQTLQWCREQGLSYFEFTSNRRRERAHKFYPRQGAKVRETTVWRMDIPEPEDT